MTALHTSDAVTATELRHPPIDAEVLQVLESRDDVVTSMSAEDVAPLRARAVIPEISELTREGEFELSVHTAASWDGHEVHIVLLRPHASSGPVPTIYHVHGGGLVVGSAYETLPLMAEVAREVGAAVASVEYRLAPEHRFPCAVEDAYAGLVWLFEQASDLGLDPARIILHGVSAGGGLAAAVALLARERGGPGVRGQMLLCPMLDDRSDTGSARQMTGVGAWDRTANQTAWNLYLHDMPRDQVPIHAAPARATNLSGLPPAFVDVGSAETFRDEVVAYASTIWACGGDAELHVWPGGVHGFDTLAPEATLSYEARQARLRWLTRLLDRSGD